MTRTGARPGWSLTRDTGPGNFIAGPWPGPGWSESLWHRRRGGRGLAIGTVSWTPAATAEVTVGGPGRRLTVTLAAASVTRRSPAAPAGAGGGLVTRTRARRGPQHGQTARQRRGGRGRYRDPDSETPTRTTRSSRRPGSDRDCNSLSHRRPAGPVTARSDPLTAPE